MPIRVPQFVRKPLLRKADLRAIEAIMFSVLEDIGIEIAHQELEQRARQQGFHLESGRIRLPRHRVEAFLEEERSQRSTSPTAPPHRSPSRSG